MTTAHGGFEEAAREQLRSIARIPADDLETDMLGEEPPWDDEPDAPPDAVRADALLRRLRRLATETGADEEIARRQVDQINAWLERRSEPRRRRAEWLIRSLKAYHEGVFARSKLATISLPSGTLKSRKQPETWEIDDEAFMAWARDHQPDLIVQPPPTPHPERLDRNGVKEFLTRRDEKGKPLSFGTTPDGEVPPGVRTTSGGRKYEVHLTEIDDEGDEDV